MDRKEFKDRLEKRVSKTHTAPAVKKAAMDVIEILADIMKDELKKTGKVTVPKLGTFKMVERTPAAKEGGEEGTAAKTGAKKKVRFVPGKSFKEDLDLG